MLCGLFLSACAKPNTERLVLTGSSTLAPLVAEIARAFEKLHPNIRIDVQTGGSSRGIADTRSGLATIGMVSRALKTSESDLSANTIAYDGITPIINAINPVSRLSDRQIAAIYQGHISNWQEVGGPDQSISVVNKAEGRSTLELFLHYFQLRNRDIQADLVIGDNQQGIISVAGNPWAIAYVSVGSAEFEQQRGTAIKLLGIGDIAATTQAVRQGDYPLSRQLNLVTLGAANGLEKRFIEFSQSSQVRNIIAQQYFIPVNIPLNAQ